MSPRSLLDTGSGTKTMRLRDESTKFFPQRRGKRKQTLATGQLPGISKEEGKYRRGHGQHNQFLDRFSDPILGPHPGLDFQRSYWKLASYSKTRGDASPGFVMIEIFSQATHCFFLCGKEARAKS